MTLNLTRGKVHCLVLVRQAVPLVIASDFVVVKVDDQYVESEMNRSSDVPRRAEAIPRNVLSVEEYLEKDRRWRTLKRKNIRDPNTREEERVGACRWKPRIEAKVSEIR